MVQTIPPYPTPVCPGDRLVLTCMPDIPNIDRNNPQLMTVKEGEAAVIGPIYDLPAINTEQQEQIKLLILNSTLHGQTNIHLQEMHI